MITLWDRSNLYFRFPNVLAIPTTPFTHTQAMALRPEDTQGGVTPTFRAKQGWKLKKRKGNFELEPLGNWSGILASIARH